MRAKTLFQAQAYGGFRRRNDALRLVAAAVVLLLLSVAIPSSSAAVIFKENHEHMYDIAPEIKVLGSGFETLIDSELEISFIKHRFDDDDDMGTIMDFEYYYAGVENVNRLEPKAIFEWEISSDTMITLKLRGQQTRWPRDHRIMPGQSTPLLIASVKAGGVELLDKPLAIATLVPSPRVRPSNNVIYAESTPDLEVTGNFFNESSERNTLFFDPPLQGVLEIRTQVHSTTQSTIIFAKEVGQWAAEPGPLILVGIDTGYGRLHVDSQGITHASIPENVGVVVAEVQAELGKNGITVELQGTLFIYQSTKRIEVYGSGFQSGMKLRFGGNDCGGGENFNITNLQPEKFTLELMDGSKWCKDTSQNIESRPLPLVLLAADAGKGWVPLGSTIDKYGQTIANVLEDPSIQPSFTREVSNRMFHTQASSLIVEGTGFMSPFRQFETALEFEPPLADQPNIIMNRRTSVIIRSESLHWTREGYVGPLSIKGMDGGAGMVVFDPPVQVATITERTVKNFAIDGHLRHKVVNETCSKLCLNFSWDAIVDGNGGVCACDQQKRNAWRSFLYDEGLHDSCDICCHKQDEWDGYIYQGHSVCVCGSGNELSKVGGDWFDEDGWGSRSRHNRGRSGGLKKKDITDEDTSKKRTWNRIDEWPRHVFDDMALAQRKMFWDLTLFLGGSASCGVGALVYIFLFRRTRSRRRA